MRGLLVLVLLATVAAQFEDEQDFDPEFAVEDAQEEEPIDDVPEEHNRSRREAEDYEYIRVVRRPTYYYEEVPSRTRRSVDDETFDEHIRVKRWSDVTPEFVRVPRKVHQYEVHEFTDDGERPAGPGFEEMLAASADHYHRVYASPGAPSAARYMDPRVSVGVFRPVSSFKSISEPLTAAPINVPVSWSVSSRPNAVYPSVTPRPKTQAFPGPVPVVSRPNIQAPFTGPVPVSSVPVSQPLKAAADDQTLAGAHPKNHHHSHGFSQGGGQKKQENEFSQQGGKTKKGYQSDQHVEKGGRGFKKDESHKKQYEEADGLTKKHKDHADHKGSHEEAAQGHRGSKFDEKKGHKKGHRTKGYHNKYHKDEFHKEHKFYDDFHKSGAHHRYGKFNAKHASNESGKKKAHHVNAGHDFVEHGKKGYSNKGHVDSDHKGHKGKHGHEEHHHHQEQHAKKGGKEGGKHWGYEKKN